MDGSWQGVHGAVHSKSSLSINQADLPIKQHADMGLQTALK